MFDGRQDDDQDDGDELLGREAERVTAQPDRGDEVGVGGDRRAGRRRGTWRTPRPRPRSCPSARPGTSTSRTGSRTSGRRPRGGRRTARRPGASWRRARPQQSAPVIVIRPGERPGHQQPAGRADQSGRLGRGDEDARADHRPHDDHRGVERPELAHQPRSTLGARLDSSVSVVDGRSASPIAPGA